MVCVIYVNCRSNVVRVNRPKMLTGLNQNGKGYRVKSLEHGKPNCLHLSMESDPQGKPIGKWVKEVGKSEGHPVMGWIRVQTLPDTKVGRLPTGVESRETYATF